MFSFMLFSLGIANQEQRSLAQRCELWKKSSQEKDLVCERAEKDKAVLSKKIQVRRIITWFLFWKWKSIAFIYDCMYIPLNMAMKNWKLVRLVCSTQSVGLASKKRPLGHLWELTTHGYYLKSYLHLTKLWQSFSLNCQRWRIKSTRTKYE